MAEETKFTLKMGAMITVSVFFIGLLMTMLTFLLNKTWENNTNIAKLEVSQCNMKEQLALLQSVPEQLSSLNTKMDLFIPSYVKVLPNNKLKGGK